MSDYNNIPPVSGQGSYSGPDQFAQNEYGDPRAYGQGQYGQPYGGGYPYPQGNLPMSDKSKIAAGLLGIFLGTFGVHNFYLGFTGKAVAQLLLTVLSIGLLSWVSGIWGLVEAVLILTAKPGTPASLDADGRVLYS